MRLPKLQSVWKCYLSDCVDLGRATTTTYLDADIESTGSLVAEKEEGLQCLGPEGKGLNEIDWGTVHLDDAYTRVMVLIQYPFQPSRMPRRLRFSSYQMSVRVVALPVMTYPIFQLFKIIFWYFESKPFELYILSFLISLNGAR